MKETFLKEAALDGREGLEYLTRGQRWFSCLCHASVCSSVLCLVTTKIWSDGHCVTALRSRIDRVIDLRSRMDHVIALRQISVTALFYLEDSRKIYLQGVRARRSKDTRRRAPQHEKGRERES